MLILIWGITLLTFRIVHYGLASGFLWWFDHWFLILSGLTLIKKNSRFQSALTFLILTIQSLWALDNLYYLITKQTGLGTTSFLFQPGVSLFEFLLLQSHFILSSVLLYKLPLEQTDRRTTIKALFFPLIIFLLSYFSPPQNDINCIHSSCSPINIHVAHWMFSALFATSACVLLYVAIRIGNKLTQLSFFKSHQKKMATTGIILGALLVLWNLQRHFSLPHFTCVSGETEDAKISCRYTTDFSADFFRMHYTISLKGKTRKECTPFLIKNGIKQNMESPILLPPKETNEFSILVPQIKESTEAKLTIECHDFTY